MTNITIPSRTTEAKGASSILRRAREYIRQLAENWQARAVIARLDRLNDKLLRDAGLERPDVEWAKQLPLAVHAERALFERVNRC